MRPLLALAVIAVPALAHADRRTLTHTNEYGTAAEGQTEVELYGTQTRATWADGAPETFALSVAIEHGISARWDVSLFQTFAQASGAGTASPLALTDVHLRTRYRFAERGELPLDVAANAELGRQFGASAYLAEARLVLNRDFGLLTLTVNAAGAITFGADVSTPAYALRFAGGATYELSPTWRAGAETWFSLDPEATDQFAGWAGPALSWAPSTNLWVTATGGFGLNDRSDRFNVRAIVGLTL